MSGVRLNRIACSGERIVCSVCDLYLELDGIGSIAPLITTRFQNHIVGIKGLEKQVGANWTWAAKAHLPSHKHVEAKNFLSTSSLQ